MKKLIVLCIYFTTIIPHFCGMGNWNPGPRTHFSDVIMSTSHITSLTFVTQLFIQAQIKENINPRHLSLWGTGEFPAHRPSNTENVSISWRHHEKRPTYISPPVVLRLNTLARKEPCHHILYLSNWPIIWNNHSKTRAVIEWCFWHE